MIEDLEKELTKLERYLKREGRQDYVMEMRRASKVSREEKLLALAKYRQQILTAMQEDPELKKAKAAVKELAAPYNENKRMNEKFSRFIHLLAKEEGTDEE